MLKKLGLPVLALAAMLALASPSKADAKVRFGVYVGTPGYYSYTYPYPYYAPYYGPYPYYAYRGPVYVYPQWHHGHYHYRHYRR